MPLRKVRASNLYWSVCFDALEIRLYDNFNHSTVVPGIVATLGNIARRHPKFRVQAIENSFYMDASLKSLPCWGSCSRRNEEADGEEERRTVDLLRANRASPDRPGTPSPGRTSEFTLVVVVQPCLSWLDRSIDRRGRSRGGRAKGGRFLGKERENLEFMSRVIPTQLRSRHVGETIGRFSSAARRGDKECR